ncbi:phage tail sheath family protein [Domibacillus tundrae]|uniref:phage tail sheath family protein n=1 Tax=Domibacillus tundrae TaxID=1587527 RepID=UPI0006183679|nr:phage tail sheath family protein [Domibacillus tundrae]
MISGTFTPGVPKERAGIYFRFTSAAQSRLAVGVRGRVVLPLVLKWGPSKTFSEITEGSDFFDKLGVDITDSSALLIKEAKKQARTVLVYRLNTGTKATGTISTGVTATAAHGGALGNSIKIVIQDNVLEPTKKDVTVYFGVTQVSKQTVATAAELKSDKWVAFTGTGALTVTAGVTLTGGADGTTTNQEYADFLAAAETQYFDTIALPLDSDTALKATFVSYIKRLRDTHGIKVVGVMPNHPGDFEGIINVTNGPILATGETLTPAQNVAWVAGASAGATMYQSLTFIEYEGAVDVTPKFDNDQIISRLKAGEFLLTLDPRDKKVSVEKDINSFTSFTTAKNKRFAKNKIIRILDAINNDLIVNLKALIKEKKDRGQDIPVNGDGAQIVRSAVSTYLTTLQEGNALTNFDPQTDINIVITDDADGFLISVGAQPVDSAEKLYFDMEVR